MFQAVPLYLAEMAPPQYRGAINNGFMTCISIGIILATLINFGTEKIHGDLGWRISLALSSVPAALLTLAAIFLPETPNSLIQRGADPQEAAAVLRRIRGTADVDKELQDLIAASNVSKTINHPFREILRLKYRPQLVMALLIPFFQQVTGINVVAIYAPILFRSIGLKESASLLSAVTAGAICLAANFVAMAASDKFGRRALFMIGGAQMLASQVIVGAVLQVELKDHGGVSTASTYSVLVLVCVYTAGFGWSWGPLGWLVPSEIFPLEIRSAGQSINLIVSFIFIFIIGQTFVTILCSFKYGIFYFFSGWVLVMTVFVHLFLPETANVPIEQMVQVWGGHWFWKRFVEGDARNYSIKDSTGVSEYRPEA